MTLLGRLELVDFPRPTVARVLSPNGGRPHWAVSRRARLGVQRRMWFEARTQHLPEMHNGLVAIRPIWTFPESRRRDGDNLTAILKSAIDALVKGGWLLDDSSEHVRLEPSVIRVTKSVRMLVLEFEQAASSLIGADSLEADLDQPTNGRAPSGKTVAELEVFDAAQ